MKTLKIRKSDYTMADFETMAAIRSAAMPRWATTGEFQQFRRNARDTDYPSETFFLLSDAETVGYVNYFQSPYAYVPDKFEVMTFFYPKHNHTDCYHDAFALVLHELEPLEPKLLGTAAAEDETVKTDFLLHYGFAPKMHENESELDMANFVPAEWKPALERFGATDLRLLTVHDLQRERPDEWMRLLYELDNELSKDVPSTGEVNQPSFAAFCKHLTEDPEFDPTMWWLAADGEQLVAITMLFNDIAIPTRYNTGLTGVRRGYRRRGIATAVKVASLVEAKARGAHSVITGNEANNPMYQINLALGFKPLPTIVFFEKHLGT